MIITLVLVRIVANSAFTIAAPERSRGGVARPTAATSDGTPIVPASGLAGSLRDHLRRLQLDEELMGSRPPFATKTVAAPTDRNDDVELLTPSPLRLLGTRVHLDGRPVTSDDLETTGQTAIDRRRGAARAGPLRHATAVPAGSVVDLFIRYDGTLPATSRQALASWTPTIGSGRTNGNGIARVADILWGTIDLGTAEGLRTWVTFGGPELFHAVCTTQNAPTPPDADEPIVDVTVQFVDGFHSTAAVDCNHRTLRQDREGHAVLSGASLKGAIRSRAEYILRSLDVEVCGDGPDPLGCGHCPVCDVFGHQGARGRLAFDVGYVQGSTGLRDHVAIDRFTGGARPGHLFSETIVEPGASLHITIRALAGLPSWVRPTLLWALADLDDGLIGLGGSTSRGLGTVRLTPDSRPILDHCEPLDHLPTRRTESDPR